MSDETSTPFIFKRYQFPVNVAFAITINKSQGQTMDKVGIYLKSDVFSHGQLYVALSRVKSSQSVKILNSNVHSNTIKNVVYPSIIQ